MGAEGNRLIGERWHMNDRLQQIRASEEKAHTEMYSNNELYQGDGWLKKPIKTVQELIPLFSAYKKLRVLDLGCGVGRNCIEVASKYKQIDCKVDGVDILPLAIKKLNENAEIAMSKLLLFNKLSNYSKNGRKKQT